MSVEAMQGYLRIGELSRRTGVSPELLRAWERRYGLLHPDRSAGGFRLYSERDEARVQAMRDHLGQGLSAAEAARLSLAGVRADGPEGARGRGPELPDAFARLRAGLYDFDDRAAQSAFDELLAGFSVDALLREVVMPLLEDLGARWASGDATIAQEHFASNLVRARLLALSMGWGQGRGPVAILACPPGEQHDVALISFGLALRARGWSITYLGTDTPIATLAETARAVKPAIVVLAAEIEEHLVRVRDEIAELATAFPVAIAGAGATAELGLRTGAQLLRDDPVTAADRLGTGMSSRPEGSTV